MSDIKLFRLSGQEIEEISGGAMALEKPLQTMFENNLDRLLGVRFLASEFQITDGRIDTLGLDENNCPVIIEYKRHQNENIINQGLFYLEWLMNHQADFKLLVMGKIDKENSDEIDWSTPRIICVAADFTRYDEQAIKQMKANIELIRYRKFGDDLFMLDLLTATTNSTTQPSNDMQSKSYKEHDIIIAEAKGTQKARYDSLVSFLLSLGDDVQKRHLKHYVAFKRIKNFACVKLQKETIIIYVDADLERVELVEGFSRDVSDVGHVGTGNIAITIASDDDLERAKPFIQQSYERT